MCPVNAPRLDRLVGLVASPGTNNNERDKAMNMSYDEHKQNAADFIALSSDLARGEKIDRAELRQQLAHTYADDDDVEAIAEMIEAINN